jgi:hypothetical protein
VVFTLDNPVAAGASGGVEVTVQINPDAQGEAKPRYVWCIR